MSVSVRELVVLAADPWESARFWGDLLGQPVSGLSLAPPGDVPFGIRFESWLEPLALPAQAHLHLTSNDTTQEATVGRAVGLGASYVDVGQRPDEGHVVLADPDGLPFCVIEGGNSWLAGSPFLGELACDGTREVGLFWSAALGWPLVHDQDGETATQSADGGPKIAWGGTALDERRGRNRMHLVLAADELEADVERLVGLGATVVLRGDSVEMTDPDGNEFRVA